jgi:prepilin-type N-terminal cleavage/methylation domain-containing protein
VHHFNRRGFTLIEFLVVTAVIGVLAAIGYPRLQQAFVKASVRSARGVVINLYQQGRALASRDGRTTTVYIGQQKVWIVAWPRRNAGTGTLDTVGVVRNLNSEYGVTLTASPDSVVALNRRGLGTSANAFGVLLTRAGYRDSVTIDAMGRVTK